MGDPENRPRSQPAESPAPTRPSGQRTRTVAISTLAVAVTVVAAAFWVASRPRAGGTDPAAITAADRAVRGLSIGAIIDRGGRQERRTTEVTVHPGDRVRVELTVEDDREAMAGFVGENGVWTELLPQARLTKGTHVCPEPLRFEDDPSSGFLVAGSPEAIEHARETDDFRGLTVLPVRLESRDQ